MKLPRASPAPPAATHSAQSDQLKRNLRIRDRLDIDGMDTLNFVIGLHKELKVEIPGNDYPKLVTLNSCTEYLASRLHVT